MGTMTAKILVGTEHSFNGETTPDHCIFLSENSRPGWILSSKDLFEKQNFNEIVWIPTVEDMIEDAMLMIGIYLLKDNNLITAADNFLKANNKYSSSIANMQRIDTVYDYFSETQRQKLYDICRNIPNLPKIIVSILEHDSTINNPDLHKILSNYSSLSFKIC